MHISEGYPGIGNGIETMMNGANGTGSSIYLVLGCSLFGFLPSVPCQPGRHSAVAMGAEMQC